MKTTDYEIKTNYEFVRKPTTIIKNGTETCAEIELIALEDAKTYTRARKSNGEQFMVLYVKVRLVGDTKNRVFTLECKYSNKWITTYGTPKMGGLIKTGTKFHATSQFLEMATCREKNIRYFTIIATNIKF